MKTKTLFFAAFMAAFLVTGLGLSNAYADHCCLKDHGDKDKGLEEVFYKKVKFLDKKQEELGLTDEQQKSIKEIKNNLKKSFLEQDAKIESFKIDIESEVYERPIDVNKVNGLIDKKYDAKKDRAKSLVKAFADLKSVLTDEQYDLMKKMWKEKMKDKKDKDHDKD